MHDVEANGGKLQLTIALGDEVLDRRYEVARVLLVDLLATGLQLGVHVAILREQPVEEAPHLDLVVLRRFAVPDEVVESDGTLEIVVDVTVIDEYKRPHALLPVSWVFIRGENVWFAHPAPGQL